MTFSRINDTILVYKIRDRILNHQSVVKDLGVLFGAQLSFNLHMDEPVIDLLALLLEIL